MNNYADILRIARAGNPSRAMQLFANRGLHGIADDPRVLTLKGRLLKDQAYALPTQQSEGTLSEAASAYLAAYALSQDSYPLINAATLTLLAGDGAKASTLAAQTLDLLDADPEQGETPYWREATRAEALLLLGRMSEADEALALGISKLPLAHEDRAATIGQFERILAALNSPDDWLDAHRVPPCLFFSGMIGIAEETQDLKEQIAKKIDTVKPSYAFGALAAGADILLAEAAREAGAQLHITLPAAPDVFAAKSVTPYGTHWQERFTNLLADAVALDIYPGQSPAQLEDNSYANATLGAGIATIGACLRHADMLRSNACAITIAAEGEAEREQVALWQESQRPLHKIVSKRSAETMRQASPNKAQRALGLLLLQGGKLEELTALCADHEVDLTRMHEAALLTGSASAMLQLARTCLSQDLAERATFLAGCDAGVEAQSQMLEKAQQISACSDTAYLASDDQSALMARALDETVRIEELGEIATLGGAVPLFAIKWPVTR